MARQMRASPEAVARLRSLGGDLGARAARRGRMSTRDRVDRLRRRSFLIVQVALAAAIAWLVARELLDHPRPFFAPVAVIVSLGLSYGQRLRRVAEVTAGVAVGVGVADLFVHVFGTGTWQIAVVVACSMAVAVLIDGGGLIVTQAGVQAVIATTLLPSPGAGLGRWLDAVVGGAVA
ncbi:MAG: FUSC family protein, partial [Actinomycetes bacterium]